jgi:hypothetical protein
MTSQLLMRFDTGLLDDYPSLASFGSLVRPVLRDEGAFEFLLGESTSHDWLELERCQDGRAILVGLLLSFTL